MDDYEAIQKRRNIVVGIFVLMGLIALVGTIFAFGDLPTYWSKLHSFEVYVQFPRASGAEQGTPVQFAGYQIGRVVAVKPPRIMRDLATGLKYYQTTVVVAIDKQFVDIPSNVQVKLKRRGFGSSYIELNEDPTKSLTRLDPNNPKSVYLYQGARLEGSIGTESEFFPEKTQKELDQLAIALKTLIDNANTMLGDVENQRNIKASVTNLAAAAKQATLTLKSIERFSDAGITALSSVNADIKNISNSLLETSWELYKTTTEVRELVQKINKGQGSAGRFVNDASLYENLLDSSLELQQAMEELKLLLAQSREKGIPIKLK